MKAAMRTALVTGGSRGIGTALRTKLRTAATEWSSLA